MNLNINLNDPNTRKFLKVFWLTLSISLIIVFSLFFLYKFIYAKSLYDPSKQLSSELVTSEKLKAEEDSKSTGFFTTPVRTNVLVVGFDKQAGLTDVIMVASYISTTGEINVISIPRDTYMSFSGDRLKELRSINSNAPSIMKINAVYNYTKKSGMEFLQKTIEDLLDININYYVKIDLEGFVNIVDAVGGIYFTVPEGGLKYSDPTQGLYINLEEGYQLLNGEQAEGLVRYRSGYARADLQRIEVQQEFIKEFAKQVLNKETLMSNLGEIALNLIKYVDTDFSLEDLPKYILSVSNIDVNNINTKTAPGYAQMIGEVSYYMINSVELKEVVDDFFYGNTDPEQEEEIKITKILEQNRSFLEIIQDGFY